MDFTTHFDRGPLKDAQLAAQRSTRLLLGYIYCDENPHCEALERLLNSSTVVQQTITNSFLLWATDVNTPEGNEYMADFGVTRLPCLVVMFRNRCIAIAQGPMNESTLLATLAKAAEVGGPDLAKEIAFQADRQERDMLRIQQETALAEAMKHDKARAAARAAEQARKAEAAREAAAEQARLEAEIKAAAEAAEEQRRREEEAARALELARAVAASSLPEEPSPETPEIAHIKLMALDGTPILRRFLGTDPVSLLFALAESNDKFDGRPYELKAGYPPKSIERTSTECFKDVKALYPRSVVTMKPLA